MAVHVGEGLAQPKAESSGASFGAWADCVRSAASAWARPHRSGRPNSEAAPAPARWRGRVGMAGAAVWFWLGGPFGMNLQQIFDLVAADTTSVEDHIAKAFDWQLERAVNAVRIGFGAAGSLVVAFIALLFKSGERLTWGEVVLMGVSVLVLSVIAIRLYVHAGKIQREYIAALQIAGEVKPLAGFLRTYQASVRRMPWASRRSFQRQVLWLHRQLDWPAPLGHISWRGRQLGRSDVLLGRERQGPMPP